MHNSQTTVATGIRCQRYLSPFFFKDVQGMNYDRTHSYQIENCDYDHTVRINEYEHDNKVCTNCFRTHTSALQLIRTASRAFKCDLLRAYITRDNTHPYTLANKWESTLIFRGGGCVVTENAEQSTSTRLKLRSIWIVQLIFAENLRLLYEPVHAKKNIL